MKYYYLLVALIVVSCSLNADQEASLNSALSTYINSHNNGAVMSYVAYTHPNAVAYYKNIGDSAFTEKFSLANSETREFLQDGIIKNILKKNDDIQVEYNFMCITDNENEQAGKDKLIFALSKDKGQTWFFLDEEDYTNKLIIKPNDRLIKK